MYCSPCRPKSVRLSCKSFGRCGCGRGAAGGSTGIGVGGGGVGGRSGVGVGLGRGCFRVCGVVGCFTRLVPCIFILLAFSRFASLGYMCRSIRLPFSLAVSCSHFVRCFCVPAGGSQFGSLTAGSSVADLG